MSIRVMSQVWQHSSCAHGDLLVLLAIADFADDTGRAFPSVHTLMGKARLSERQVRQAIKNLVASGELEIAPSGGPAGCNAYKVCTGADSAPRPPAKSAPPAKNAGAKTAETGAENAGGGADSAPGGVQLLQARGADSAPPPITPYMDEPSLNRQLEPSGGGGEESAPSAPAPPPAAADPSGGSKPKTETGEASGETAAEGTEKAPARSALEVWADAFRAKQHRDPTFVNAGTATKKAGDLARNVGKDKFLAAVAWFFSDTDPWYRNQGYQWQHFVRQFDAIVAHVEQEQEAGGNGFDFGRPIGARPGQNDRRAASGVAGTHSAGEGPSRRPLTATEQLRQKRERQRETADAAAPTGAGDHAAAT